MAAVVNDPMFFQRMLILIQCVEAEIAAAGLKPVAYAGVLPGEQAIADWCYCDGPNSGGQAWVRLAGILPVQSNQVDPVSMRCMPPLEAQIEVGIMRCAPTLDQEGNPPTMAQELEATRIMTADMAALLRAITCDCTGFPMGDVRVLNWVPIAEQGGCVGGVWQIMLSQSYGG